MTVGIVRYFSEIEGFGYIESVDGNQIYFHYTAIAESGGNKAVKSGLTVTYDLIETRLGLEAANIRRTSPEMF